MPNFAQIVDLTAPADFPERHFGLQRRSRRDSRIRLLNLEHFLRLKHGIGAPCRVGCRHIVRRAEKLLLRTALRERRNDALALRRRFFRGNRTRVLTLQDCTEMTRTAAF